MTLAGRIFSSRYEIEREVAQGGMAEVYLARDQLLNRPVALKALFPEYAREPSFVERFRREAQAAANLNHPNIVAIYDWGQEAGTYFIVMEYVEGRSLRDLIRSEGPLDPNQAAEITAEIASGLGFAHRNGVVHRDVKPGNVLLTRTGNVKVTDFGIARAGASEALTQTGSVMGTATYFSPEQAQGMPVDGRSDVYSLGVVLYEMLTGVAPFTGDSPLSVAYKHVREEPVPPSQRNPEIPEDLEQIILTALAKDPDHRYQTADDMRADLLRFRRGRPLAAAPVTAMVAEVPTSATQAAAAGAYAAAATMATPRADAAYAEPTPPPRRRTNPALVGFLVLLGLAAVVLAILGLSAALGSNEGKTDVPSVIDKPVDVAQKEIRNAHLIPEVVTVSDSTHAVNTVIDQNPKAGAHVSRNSTVKLTVSGGTEQVMIPTDIVGKLATDAQTELQALGFQVSQQQQASDAFDKDHVIDSNPASGQRAPKGSNVTLFVSSGKAAIAIPDVKGMQPDQAGQTLRSKGFKTIIGPVQEASDSVPSGAVTRTDPPAGKTVSADTPITVYVSSGSGKVTVPPEIGKSPAAAKADLEALGFTVTQLNKIDDANVGVVADQDPKPGTQAAKGSNVTIYVGISSGGTTSTT